MAKHTSYDKLRISGRRRLAGDTGHAWNLQLEKSTKNLKENYVNQLIDLGLSKCAIYATQLPMVFFSLNPAACAT